MSNKKFLKIFYGLSFRAAPSVKIDLKLNTELFNFE